MTKRAPWLYIALATAAAVLVVGGGYWLAHRTPKPSYATAPVTRGDVVTTITASGTVNPVITVQVGTYVSGTITALPCDYNTLVHKGQLCAKIDPAPYQIIVDEDQADLATAQAQLVKDQANAVYTARANQRAALLFKEDSGSHDAADAALDADNQARALVKLDAAQVADKAALLKAAQINLNYTNIISPVNGTVVSRNVTAGQTVAASLQTPTLFLIATDLTKMQVDTNVSESDIAGARPGRRGELHRRRLPKQTFLGQVAQVRQAPDQHAERRSPTTWWSPSTIPDLLLKPGMTATAKIDTAQSLQRRAGSVSGAAIHADRRGQIGHRRRPAGGRSSGCQRAGKLIAVPVTVGLDDDTYAEIKSGGLELGDEVVTAEAPAGSTPPAGATAPLRCNCRRPHGRSRRQPGRPDPILRAGRHRRCTPCRG